ncbi:hypothetical protein GW916_13370 [bacterium]|nr:hypothetical protein [bacterium]
MRKSLIATIFLLSQGALSTEIELAPGSSAKVEAGETVTVSCTGEGSSSGAVLTCVTHSSQWWLIAVLPDGSKETIGSFGNKQDCFDAARASH